MKVVLYLDRNMKDSKINEGLTAVQNYFSKLKNIQFQAIEYKNFRLVQSDYAIIWNVYCKFKGNTKYRDQITQFQKQHNNKLIIIELGFLKRQQYFSIGYDHISNFGNYPSFPDNNERLLKLNLNIKPIRYDKNPDQPILLCTQLPWDTQTQYINYTTWLLDSITSIKKYTKRPIRLRIHPKHKPRNGFDFYNNEFLRNKGISDIQVSTKSLEADLDQCYCVVAYNSTILVDAILAGVPIVAGDSSSIVYDLAVTDFSRIEQLTEITNEQIQKCLEKVAYKQWSAQEITNGEPFKYYL